MNTVFVRFHQVDPEGSVFLDITQVTAIVEAGLVGMKESGLPNPDLTASTKVMCAGVEYHIYGLPGEILDRVCKYAMKVPGTTVRTTE